MLGDRLIAICLLCSVGAVVAEFFFAALVMLVTIVPQSTQSEAIMQQILETSSRMTKHLMRYALAATAVLVIVRFVSHWLGWSPPVDWNRSLL